MKKRFLFLAFGSIFLLSIFYSCTKDVGANPLIAASSGFTDKALLDSCKNDAAFTFYKGNNNFITTDASAGSPHGNFKLKFNKIAAAALGSDGELPAGQVFPNGSMVVKETQSNYYAFIYKKDGAWLWGEANFDGSILIQSVVSDATAACINCHTRPGVKDFVVSFDYY